MLTHAPRHSSADEGARLLAGAFQLDQSTSISQLGSLFEYQGDRPVQKLKRRLADAYGMAWSFPSTHGTTALNILALLTACPAGGRVLVNRDAHSSVNAAMIQGGFHPVYFVAAYDSEIGVTLGATAAGVQEVLDREPVDCVFLTSPNYFGIVGELPSIVALAHERGLPVVVDAAHAPHFHFCDLLPAAAEDVGADFVAQSTHKVATALSQGSLLLLRNADSIPCLYEHVNELGLVSTSFSYPILASLELGVRQLVEEGDDLWRATIARAETFRAACRRMPGLACFGDEQQHKTGFTQLDPTRVTIDVSRTGLTGIEFERRLHGRRIYPELATLQNLLFLFTPGTRDEDAHRLYAELEQIAREATRTAAPALPAPPAVPEMAMVPRAAKFSRKTTVALREAIGRISGETIATYPPGVPIVAAGEIVTAEIIEYLQYMHVHGAALKGSADPEFRTLKVL
jgi:ornithine decarboxylase